MLLGRNSGRTLAAAGAALIALSGSALADGYGGSIKDAPVEEGRKFSWSITLGGTSDYVFRGISQTFEDPAVQGSLDVGYGIFYAGVWGSNIDFGEDQGLGPKVTAEVDLYAGIKPTWGPVTFDFGGIYYAYPNSGTFANFNGGSHDVDYFEFKAGYSLASPWIKNLTTGTTVYWSPDYSFNTGDVCHVGEHGIVCSAPVRNIQPEHQRYLRLGLWRPQGRLQRRRHDRGRLQAIGTPAFRSLSRSSPSTSATGTRIST